MLHCDASPSIAPVTPTVKPSSSPASSQTKEAAGPSAMQVDSGASTELAVVGEEATQESAAHQMAEAPTKDAISSGKVVVEGGTSAEGGTPAPKKTIEYPKIVYPVLTPGSTALVPGVATTSPMCGLEEFSGKQRSCKEIVYPSASYWLRVQLTSRSLHL